MLNELKTLCGLPGISGAEHSVRDYIIEQLDAIPGIAWEVDALGNLIIEKRGAQRAGKTVMLSAHMDEVGLIVTYITDDGYLKFEPVGGIDPRVLLGRRVRIGTTLGVIGLLPVHLLRGSDSLTRIPGFSDLYIDIGASGKEQAESLVSPGDAVIFESSIVEYGDGLLKAKALDDRFGCAVLLRLLREELPYDVTVCFVVQEEVGLRGATTAAFSVQPDIGIIVEATTANDTAGITGAQQVCRLKAGGVLSFMDGRTVYDRGLYTMALELAEQQGIPVQSKTAVAGGNDAGAVQVAGAGAKVIAVSLPCRYIHSGSSVCAKEDMESAYRLVKALIPAVQGP